jgi:hypothetical protein
MIAKTKRRFVKRYVVGGAGIFDTISGFVKRMLTSNTARQVAATAVSAGKEAATEIGKKAIDVGKTVAINAGKRLVDRVAAKMSAPSTLSQKSKEMLQKTLIPPETLSPKSEEMLQNILHPQTNINNLLSGTGGAVSIQDLVRGSGMKWA